MRTRTTFLLCIATMLNNAIAQIEEPEVVFIPGAVKSRAYCMYHNVRQHHVIGEEAVHMFFLCGKTSLYKEAYSRVNGELIAKDSEQIVDDMVGKMQHVTLSGRTYLLISKYERKEGRLEILAYGIDPSSMKIEAPRKVMTISFAPKEDLFDWNIKVAYSKERDRAMIYSDRIYNDKDHQVIECAIFAGPDLEKKWRGTYTTSLPLVKVSTIDALIDSSGSNAYFLVEHRSSQKREFGFWADYEYDVFKLDRSSISSHNVNVGKGQLPLSCRLIVDEDGSLLLGGFATSNRGITEAHFTQNLSADLSEVAVPKLIMFDSTVSHQLLTVTLLTKDDGGSFLIGGSIEKYPNTDANIEKWLSVLHLDEYGDIIWRTEIPRKLAGTSGYENGHLTLLVKDELAIILPDIEENVSMYQANQSLKQKFVNSQRIRIFVEFSDTGKPDFRLMQFHDVKLFSHERWDRNDLEFLYTGKDLNGKGKKKWGHALVVFN